MVNNKKMKPPRVVLYTTIHRGIISKINEKEITKKEETIDSVHLNGRNCMWKKSR